MRLVPWLVAVVSAVFGVTVGGYAALTSGDDPFAGLERVSRFDYTNTYPDVGIEVVCEAWTNEPDRDFDEAPGDGWQGVRYMRDCVIR